LHTAGNGLPLGAESNEKFFKALVVDYDTTPLPTRMLEEKEPILDIIFIDNYPKGFFYGKSKMWLLRKKGCEEILSFIGHVAILTMNNINKESAKKRNLISY
jgi:hypothetical protein